MSQRKEGEIHEAVKTKYRDAAQSSSPNPGCCSPTCCSGAEGAASSGVSLSLGYSVEALSSAPQGSSLGLGCGNPLAIASLEPGETVLDIGSGGGFDAFLAAKTVGESGRVIGIDMTPEMVSRARRLAADNGYVNVEFHLGEMENLPIPDDTVDVIISNCVINLSLDKRSAFHEAWRVLRPGGRLAISDVVAAAPLPPELKNDPILHSECVAGASTVDELEALLKNAGFAEIHIEPRDESKSFIRDWSRELRAEDYVLSAYIEAVKKPGPGR